MSTPTKPTTPIADIETKEPVVEESSTVDTTTTKKSAPIGKVEDVLHTKGTTELKSAEENQKKDVMPDDEKAKEQPITSLAQLRDHRLKHGTPPGPIADKEREQVKKLEEKILEEGSDKVRGSAASGKR